MPAAGQAGAGGSGGEGAETAVSGELRSHENGTLLLLGVTFGFLFFDRNASAFLSPMIAADLHLSNTQIGLLGSGLSIMWAVSAALFAVISDRTGARKPLLIACVIVFSVCSILSGLSGSFATLLASRMLMGVAEGPFLPIAMAIMMAESSPGRRGFNMGAMQNTFSALMGSFLAPLVLVAVAQWSGWRSAFFLAGVPGLLCAAAIAAWIQEPPRLSTPSDEAPPGSDPHRASVLQTLRTHNVWLCALISCFLVAWMVIGWLFLPVFFVNFKGLQPSDMSAVMSVLGICAAVSGLAAPALSDKVGRKPVIIACCALGVLTPLVALYWTGPLIVLGALMFVGWVAAGVFPLFMGTIPAESSPPTSIAFSMGFVVGVGEIIGGSGGPALAGWAADRTSLVAPLLIEAGCAVCACVAALYLIETSPARRMAWQPAKV